MFLPRKILEEKLRNILSEDIGQGDITTALIVPEATHIEAEAIAKEAGVIAGIEEAKIFLESLGIKVNALAADGDEVKKNQKLMKIFGDARTILSVERTLLNILSRMSGIATTTRKLVKKLQELGFKTKIASTRKTAPGLSYFDKKAVIVGGGDSHRLHLDDMVLIKDNHIAVAGSVKKAVKKVRKNVSFSKKIEVEATSVEDALIAAKTGADIVMLDNFSPNQVKKAIKLLESKGLRDKILIEASGGITEENLLEYAEAGVDIISLGEITDSSKALDISLEVAKISLASK